MKNSSIAIKVNKNHWNTVTQGHIKSNYYPIDKIKKGMLSISKVEREDLGTVNGLYGAHLQCGLGLDTISLSRMGATMIGFDISSTAIEEANIIASSCNQDIKFVESSIYEIPSKYFNKFDFIYTSHGVLRWLPNLEDWATIIFKLLKKGGMFYIFEIHPMVYKLKNVQGLFIDLFGNYFDESVKLKEINKSHAINLIDTTSKNVAHADWTLQSIIKSIQNSGLLINSFKEFPGCSYNRHSLFPKQKDNLWYPINKSFPIPLSFSIKANKY